MTESEILAISKRTHEKGKCGGFMDVTDFQTKQKSPIGAMVSFGERPIQERELVNKLMLEVSSAKIQQTVEKLSSFRNRHYQSDTGVEAAVWIKSQFESLAAHRKDVSVRVVMHQGFKQPSVVATVHGKSDEIIVLGAHEDSINQSSWGGASKAIAPGADDDASGVATLLEAFRVLVQSDFQPERTIEFMTYAGEERGLLGSQDIASRYQREKKKVIAAFQLDMTMHPGGAHKMTLINDHVNQGLTAFTGKLISDYLKMPWTEDKCGYGCSDHASWDSFGFPAVFPFEAPTEDMNHKIHTEEDTLKILDVEFGSHFSKLALAFAVELAKN